jgi:hypothetical protein
MAFPDRRDVWLAPKDGTKVYLILSDAMGEWKSLAKMKWNGKAWISCDSGLPISSLVQIVGWIPADP